MEKWKRIACTRANSLPVNGRIGEWLWALKVPITLLEVMCFMSCSCLPTEGFAHTFGLKGRDFITEIFWVSRLISASFSAGDMSSAVHGRW